MRRILIIPVIVSLLYLSTFPAYGQSGNDIPKAIVTGLKDFTSTHNTEKAYLHFDKPYYATGYAISTQFFTSENAFYKPPSQSRSKESFHLR